MKITVAHSPDSDDAFMFYGLATGHVPTEGIEVEHLLVDIETLNRAAFSGTYEVSAVSFNAYAHLTDKYLLLPHGSAVRSDRLLAPAVVISKKKRPRARERGVWVGSAFGHPAATTRSPAAGRRSM